MLILFETTCCNLVAVQVYLLAACLVGRWLWRKYRAQAEERRLEDEEAEEDEEDDRFDMSDTMNHRGE